jgi:hypothetical protein
MHGASGYYAYIVKADDTVERRVVEVAGMQDDMAIVDKLLDLSNRAGEKEGMVHHDLQILAFGEFDQFLRLREGRRKGLFDKHMLAILKRFLGQLVVA